MGDWLEALEGKARIIHGQMAVAQSLAKTCGLDPEDIARPYYELLNELYRDEFDFARLVDSADLVTRFVGPALENGPTMAIVTSVCTDLRGEIRNIAKSIVGLSGEETVRWPSRFDPRLAGLSPGSLVLGITIQCPSENDGPGQSDIPGMSESLVEAIRGAVRSVATVARHVRKGDVDTDALQSAFPDPAVRDTVMLTASKLAPTGRRGIDSVSFYAGETGAQAAPLTRASRHALRQALDRPIRVGSEGSFEGVVRAVDFDARRFEIRSVEGVGTIRCMYQTDQDSEVASILDTRVQVSGSFEALPNRKPRFIAVESISRVRDPQGDLLKQRLAEPD